MIPMLADAATPSANTVWLVLISLVMVASGLAQVGSWWQGRQRKSTTIDGQPVEVKVTEEMHKEFASKKEFEEFTAKAERQRTELWVTLRAENLRLDNNVTVVRENVAALAKSTELQNEHLAKMDDKLDAMPDRVIATLRNTGAIGKHV